MLVMGAAYVRTNASCGCVPCVRQIAEVATTKDEKNQFISKFISYFSVFIIVLVFNI